MERKQKQEIKKHVATIHCANGLSLLQRKVSNALLYHAYPKLVEQEEHDISVGRLCQIIGYSGHNHEKIKEALRGLLSSVIEWNVIDTKTAEEDWTASSILASVNIKGPVCTYAYSPRMRKLLHLPSIYGKINLIVQSRFKSSYGLALYENCVRYQGLVTTKWFEYSVFRKLMGVPDGKYKVFRDFKKRVLEKSVEEVNSYSDLIVVPEIKRAGRQVQSIRFLLKDRPKRQRMGTMLQHDTTKINEEGTNQELPNQLITDFGLSAKQAQKVLKEYGETYIKEKVAIVKVNKTFQAGLINNLSAYLLSALKEDYQQKSTSRELARKVKLKHERQQQLELERDQTQKCDYTQYMKNCIETYLHSLGEKDMSDLQDAFYLHLVSSSNTYAQSLFDKYGIQHKVVRAHLNHFIKTNDYCDILTFDKFLLASS